MCSARSRCRRVKKSSSVSFFEAVERGEGGGTPSPSPSSNDMEEEEEARRAAAAAVRAARREVRPGSNARGRRSDAAVAGAGRRRKGALPISATLLALITAPAPAKERDAVIVWTEPHKKAKVAGFFSSSKKEEPQKGEDVEDAPAEQPAEEKKEDAGDKEGELTAV